ncbi:MAG: hypothetical protein QME12_01660 [Nanoarchaeota archaeon]|nr:hypothetical protein [Nanoarchaeota archaeon]
MKKEANPGQSALTEFSVKRSPKKKAHVKEDIALNISAITNKIAAKLVREKLFRNKKEALEVAVGFFLVWYTNPAEFEKLNAKRNNAPPEAIKTVQDITSDILRGLPTKSLEELKGTKMDENPQ